MKLGRKAQLAPTEEQIKFFEDCCATQRIIYNWALAQHDDEYERTNALVQKALFAFDTETLLRFTRVGEISKKQQKDGKSLATREERVKALEELRVKWLEYQKALTAWKAKDKGSRGERPRSPSLQLCVTSMNDLKKLWRDKAKGYRNPEHGFDWMQQVPSAVIDAAFNNLMAAFTRWYEYLKLSPAQKLKVPKVGHPKFKKKHHNSSFGYIRGKCTNKKTGEKTGGIIVTEDTIEVVNLGTVKLQERGYLPTGRYGGKVSISTSGNRWFVSITEDAEYTDELPVGRPEVGVDVNVVNFATLYPSGEVIANPRILDKYDRRLKILQRRLSRKKRGSGRYEHCRRKINRLHHLISCARATFQHQLTTDLVRKYSKIAVETLSIQAMMHDKKEITGKRRRKLNRDISDVAWYEFRRQLTYKGKLYGSEVVAVDRWFPSTKQCSDCGSLCEVNWRTRKCKCTQCQLEIDMDDNAAKNLLQQATG